jgi:hypothetical protein
MKLNQITVTTGEIANSKAKESVDRLNQLIEELQSHKLPDDLVSKLNSEVERVNGLSPTDKSLRKEVQKAIHLFSKSIIKEAKLVPKGYQQMLWTGIGMAAFGVPIGIGIGTALDNMAFLGIGLAFGLPIGMAVGAAMDEKAKKEGRQLNWK